MREVTIDMGAVYCAIQMRGILTNQVDTLVLSVFALEQLWSAIPAVMYWPWCFPLCIKLFQGLISPDYSVHCGPGIRILAVPLITHGQENN